jgi:hypothetical protein
LFDYNGDTYTITMKAPNAGLPLERISGNLVFIVEVDYWPDIRTVF